MKLQEENKREKLHDIDEGNGFLDMSWKAQQQK